MAIHPLFEKTLKCFIIDGTGGQFPWVIPKSPKRPSLQDEIVPPQVLDDLVKVQLVQDLRLGISRLPMI